MFGKFLVALAFVAVAQATNVNECRKAEHGPLPTSVDIANCATMPCNIVIGQTASMEVAVTVPRDTAALPFNVTAILQGLEVPYPMPDNNACNGLTSGSCPVVADDAIIWGLEFFVSDVFPEVNDLDIEFVLQTDDMAPIACFSINANVVAGRK